MTEEDIAFEMIVRAGEGRAKVYEAIRYFGEGDEAGYRRALAEAEEKLVQAHDVQTRYMQDSALAGATDGGRGPAPGFLLVHAQDILMAATTEKELAAALIAAAEKRLATSCSRPK